MTWFGPMGGPGGHGGGLFANSQAPSSLPFGGIPNELQKGIEELVKDEPEVKEPDVHFGYKKTSSETNSLTLRKILGQFKGLVLFALLATVGISIFSQAGPKLVQIAIDDAIIKGSLSKLILYAFIFFLAVLLSAFLQRLQVILTGKFSSYACANLQKKVFEHLEKQSIGFYTEQQGGVLLSRMTSDIENLRNLLRDGLSQLVIQALSMVVITIVLFTLNPFLAFITVIAVIPPLFAFSLWFRKSSDLAYLRVRDTLADVLGDLSENLHGMRIVSLNNRQRINISLHEKILRKYQMANNKGGWLAAVYGPGSQMFGMLSQGGLLGLGGYFVTHHKLSVGALVGFYLYLNRFFSPISLLVQQYNSFQQGYASIRKLDSLLKIEPDLVEEEAAINIESFKGDIELKNVGFYYKKSQPVLRNINLHIKAGEKVALVGPTGAGKSTIAKLIARFYDPTEGDILIDGVPLASISFKSLRSQLVLVPQEPYLFEGTLFENIAFAKPEAPEEEVRKATEKVGLGYLISSLKDGLFTRVSERGNSLSSGEKQLIALARAFLRNPKMLILDEATSNLDASLELLIEKAVDVILENKTAIIVAHRLSTAQRADRIVVVDNGSIVETGSHQELIDLGRYYSLMYSKWKEKYSVSA